MIDGYLPGVVVGGMALALAILYGAWHEFRASNRRDARLLAALGSVGVMGSAVAWFA